MSFDRLTGAQLRAERLRAGRTIRSVARVSGMSHGHLSGVERGRRPVTPPVVDAYRKSIPDFDRLVAEQPAPAAVDGYERRRFRSQVSAAVWGLASPSALLRAAGPPPVPGRVDAAAAASLELAAGVLVGDLGGAMAHALLPWVLTLPIDGPTGPRVRTAVARLAQQAAAAAIRDGRDTTGRDLLVIALDAAVRSGDPSLRAEMIADIAAHHLQLGQPADAAALLQLVEGDDQINEDVRQALKEIRAAIDHGGIA